LAVVVIADFVTGKEELEQGTINPGGAVDFLTRLCGVPRANRLPDLFVYLSLDNIWR